MSGNAKIQARVETFGCRLNAYESQVIRDHLAAADVDDAIVFNTCAVTAEAERQARQAIRKARRANPDARIVVTGCAAQIDPAKYAAMEEVDQVVGNIEKLSAETWDPKTWGATDPTRVRVNDIMSVRETASHLVRGLEARARAFVQVQQGCDHRCTFCIIPFGRGNSRSVPIGAIADQVRLLVEEGYREVVLTGVDITSYGPDLPGQPSLGQMIRRLLAQVPELPRLRLSSLDMVEVDADLRRLIAEEERLMPHLHLSLQAGDDMILKRMKRRHSREDSVRLCAEMRDLRPDITFGADLIAGFPTETDEMFENSRALITDCDLTYLHVFPYSSRAGTPAAHMPQVPSAVRKQRAAVLRTEGEAALARYLNSRIGEVEQVLLETPTSGHSSHFAPVDCAEVGEVGEIVALKMESSDGKRLIGKRTRREAA